MAKRIVVCCDGTWNTAGQESNGRPRPTNVVRLRDAIAPRGAAGTEQRVYYREGVGTKFGEMLRGGAFGLGLSQNVVDAYEFLVRTYDPGDEIYLFGFSRGAFTARSLGGLVRKSGILRREHAGRVLEAWTLYRDASVQATDRKAADFRARFSAAPRIRFIGVWDTVGALGIPVLGPAWARPMWRRINKRWSFHDTKLSTEVDGAFQALAIDEQRSVFEPALWHADPNARGQELEQVWFAGHHCGVGGGLTDSRLPDVALLWMADRAGKYGLEFRPGAFDRCRPDPAAPFGSSRTGVYRLTVPLHRPIAQARTNGRLDGEESVADTAVERRRRLTGYRPKELQAFLTGPSRDRITQIPLPPG